MNEIYMKYVASIFDLELDEPFMLVNLNDDVNKGVYVLTKNGLKKSPSDIYEHTPDLDTLLCDMLRGLYIIKKIPWKPHFGEIYYIPSLEDGEAYASKLCWADAYIDDQRYGANLVCKSEDEAIVKAEKMLAMLKDGN